MTIWYAVQRSRCDSWDYGSYDREEALTMLREQGGGLIAVIAETFDDSECIAEYDYEEVIS